MCGLQQLSGETLTTVDRTLGTTRPLPERVAIIGCGFTGTSALHQLVERYPVREITIFEKSGEFGPGYPYGISECRDYLLNSATDTLCIEPGDRKAFLRWLTQNVGTAPIEAKGYRPRAEFGAFLADTVRTARTSAAHKGIRVTAVPAEVTAVHENPAGTVDLVWPGGCAVADAVILATGRCPDMVPPGLPEDISEARYFPSQVDSDGLDAIPLDATCHVLGASLSAYDIINRMFGPGTGCRFERGEDGLRFIPGPNRRRVVLCSRSGRLKKVQSLKPMPIARTRLAPEVLRSMAHRGQLTIEAVASLVNEEAVLHRAVIDWPSVLDPYSGCESDADIDRRAAEILAADIANASGAGTNNFLVDLADDAQLCLWDAFAAYKLPPDEELRYRRRIESAFLTYAAPCPVTTAERLLALLRCGRVSIRTGVKQVLSQAAGGGFLISHKYGEERASILINATGAMDRRVSSERQSALVGAMRAAGIFRPYLLKGMEDDGASVDMSTFRATGSRSIYIANMFLWGPGFFTSSAFMMATVVEQILRAIYQPGSMSALKQASALGAGYG